MRRAQLSFGDGLIAEEVSDLREDWMRHADQVLADEQIVAAVYEALAKRHPKSRSRGRLGTAAEVVLRLLVLKHIRNWSYMALEREVRANLVYRDFTRVGAAKTPDAKTIGRWGVALGPPVLKQVHERMVKIARDQGVTMGRRMRVDATVVETNIHHPTDSTLLGDGVRVLTRIMKKMTAIAGAAGTRLRDRSRFEPATEVIRKGKAGKPNEFGNMVKLQEAENQIVIDYEVYDRRPSDADLLIPAIEIHQTKLGRPPRLVAADAAFYSAKNDAATKAMGVKRVCIPNRSSKSRERKREQKKRWFRNGQKWRTGCEGRISVVKRRHGLDRCRYKGFDGMNRWVGLGIIADTVVNIGRTMEKHSGQ
jgi:IS5 family transposase